MATITTQPALWAQQPEPAPQIAAAPVYVPRRAWHCLPFFFAALIFGLSWAAGGMLALNNLGWVIITCWCIVMLIDELRHFAYRMGVGGFVLYGGVLIWLCEGYFENWSAADVYHAILGTEVDTLATATKVSFYNALFFGFAVLGMLIPWGKSLVRFIARMPEPLNPSVLLGLVLSLFIFGLLPYALFTAEPFHEAIWRSLVSMRNWQESVRWTVGRTGNMNYAWGAYVAQWVEVGRFATILAAFYACFFARSAATRTLCWAIWLFGLFQAFGTGTRGVVVFVALPAAAFVFLRYQYLVQSAYRWLRAKVWRGLTIAVLLLAVAFVMIQTQGYFRGAGLGEASLTTQQLTEVQGNETFSMNMFVFTNIPRLHWYFIDNFPGQGAIMAVPWTAAQFFIHPIPRALWHGKPYDPLWYWINTQGGFAEGGDFNTTLAKGLVGSWYGKFGPAGVIEGGLFWGWLLFLFDRLLWLGRYKPILILLALSGHTWLLRTFRDMVYGELYSSLIGIVLLAMLLMLFPRRKIQFA